MPKLDKSITKKRSARTRPELSSSRRRTSRDEGRESSSRNRKRTSRSRTKQETKKSSGCLMYGGLLVLGFVIVCVVFYLQDSGLRDHATTKINQLELTSDQREVMLNLANKYHNRAANKSSKKNYKGQTTLSKINKEEYWANLSMMIRPLSMLIFDKNIDPVEFNSKTFEFHDEDFIHVLKLSNDGSYSHKAYFDFDDDQDDPQYDAKGNWKLEGKYFEWTYPSGKKEKNEIVFSGAKGFVLRELNGRLSVWVTGWR